MTATWLVLAWLFAGITSVYVIAPAGAQVPVPTPGARGVRFDCAELAAAIGRVAIYRDVDADQAKTIAMFRAKNPQVGMLHMQAIEREIRRVWREGLAPGEAEFALYRRCQAQLGDMGMEG